MSLLLRVQPYLNALRDAPDAVSRSRSEEAEASCLLLGEKTTALTRVEWHLIVSFNAPVTAFQSRTVQSAEAEARCLPLDEKATTSSQAKWPLSIPFFAVGMQACGDVMIGQHGRSVHEAIPHICGAKAIPTSYSCHHHHLEINSQSIKPTVERLSYILHDSSISRDLTC